jgi:predicted small lipoprotein YifL
MSKLLASFLIALTLAACGVRGDPQAPSEFTQSQ